MTKLILCLDFDGVIHSYTSGWKGAINIPDPPVPGALEFINAAMEHFKIAVLSSRSGHPEGPYEMRKWLRKHWLEAGLPGEREMEIEWPTEKPAAFITIDDRALLFNGDFRFDEVYPTPESLLQFKPWNKR